MGIKEGWFRKKRRGEITFFLSEMFAALCKVHEASDRHIVACAMTAKGAELSGPYDANLQMSMHISFFVTIVQSIRQFTFK